MCVTRSFLALFGCAVALSACTTPGAIPGAPTGTAPAPGQFQLSAEAPPGAPAGSCWAKAVTPAVIETIERDVLLKPARISSDGLIQAPPVYRRETRQDIVRPRQVSWEQTPCPADLTPEFIASLQRALAARGYYAGPPTGEIDRLTRRAIRRVQAADGFDSDILSVATARNLGLWTVDLPPASQ